MTVGGFLVAISLIALVCHPNHEQLRAMEYRSAQASSALLLMTLISGVGLLVTQRIRSKLFLHDDSAGRGKSHETVPVLLSVVLGVSVFVEANGLVLQDGLMGSVVSLSRKDGRTLWVREALKCSKRRLPGGNTHATPTAVTDGQYIVAWFGSAGLVCLDDEGRIVWKKPELRSDPIYGAASSPVLKDGVLILVSDLEIDNSHKRASESWIAGVELATGRCLWRRRRRLHQNRAGYATPVVETRSGRSVVWVHGWYGLEGYDVQTGEPVGRYAYEFRGAHLVASPVLQGDRLFIPGAKIHLCVDLNKIVAGEEPVIWSQESSGEMSATPVATGDLLFLIDEHGKATCLDLTTGAIEWQKRFRGRYSASPVVLADRVCFFSERGVVSIVAADRELKVVDQYDLGEPIHASPAVVENMLIRTDLGVHCLSQPRSWKRGL